ncbi:MAG: ATP-dependent helicase [Phycisphaerales bacterium JB059]
MLGADDQILEGLNKAQHAAVTHAGAPLVVLAGPGTGKTRVITRRVAYRVRTLGAEPESVLALTFTNKAAGEMRERLGAMLGVSVAERLNVHTFHSFGRRLLTRFADIAGLPPNPVLVDSAQQRRLLREVIVSEGLYAESRGPGIDSAVDHAAKMMETLRNHAIGPEEAVARAERHLEDPALEEDGRALGARFLSAARAYGAYERACRERGWMSFSDMVLRPIEMIRESALVREVCRGELSHVVVDEFQDVNRAQIELLRAISPPGEGRDLCVVGDDDQAIYAFRGADERAFAHFREIWGDLEMIALTESYRSERAIIEASQATIARCAERFAPDKTIERAGARRDDPPAPGSGVEVVRLEDDGQQGEIAVATILTDMRSREGARLSDYAVIGRTHAECDRVRRALELEGVPTRSPRGANAGEDEGVRDVLAWAELLCEPEAPWLARRTLLRPPLSFDLDEVNAWERAYRAQSSRAEAGDPGVAAPGAYIPWLLERQRTEECAEGFERLASWWTTLREAATSRRADEALTTIVQVTGVAHADLLDPRARARRIEAIVSMIRFARGRVSRLDQPADLRAFLAYLDDLDPRDRGFSSPDPEAALEPESAEGADGEEAVSVLTAHASKGLEFDTVILPRVTPQHGYPKTSGSPDEAPPEGVLQTGETRSFVERRDDEERRVFYVACTRAQRRLVLLAKLPKGRSSATHYTLELLGEKLATERSAREVLEEAGGDQGDALQREIESYKAKQTRADVIERARRSARLDAAAALHRADRPGAGPAEIERAATAATEAVRRMAVIASVEQNAAVPAWVAGEELRRFAERLVDRVSTDGEGAPAGVSGSDELFAPLEAPLRLSYSHVKEYRECPRCFYLRRVLRLGDPPGRAMLVGQVVHDAMERFTRERGEAENEGAEAPGADRLLEIGRARYFAMLQPGASADEAQLNQIVELLRSGARMLEEPGVHILEPERKVVFPYEHDGIEHAFEAKIDRVDQLGDGAETTLRIVDYKTGRPTKALLEPGKTDLQLAIYALALRHEYGEEAVGVGEYWLLQTGQRGRLDLGAIDAKKVKQQIDGAIEGMLAGHWPRKCRENAGSCSIIDGL